MSTPKAWTWADAQRHLQESLIRRGRKLSGVSRYLACARRFCAWAEEKGLSPATVGEHKAPLNIVDDFREHLSAIGVKPPTLHTEMTVARSMVALCRGELDESAQPGEPTESAVEPAAARVELQAVEDEMQSQGEGPDGTKGDDGIDDPENGTDTPDGEGLEQPEGDSTQAEMQIPARRTRGSNTINLRIGTQQPRQRKPPGAASGNYNPLNRVFRPADTAKVRISKRNREGKLVTINDYTAREVQGDPYSFIKKWVDPNHKEPSGITTYYVHRVGPNNEDQGSPMEVNIESEVEAPPQDGLDQVQRAMGLVQEVREMESSRSGEMKEVLELAKQRIAQGREGGGMGDILMLGMMQRMFEGGTGKEHNLFDAALKIAQQMRPAEATSGPTPPPTPVNELKGVVEALLAHSLKAPEQKDLVGQLKDLVVLKELFQPAKNEAVEMLREEMKAMRQDLARLGQAPAPGSFAGALDQVKQIAEGLRTVAPMFNMGGIGGIIQAIMGSPMAKEVASGIGAAVQKAMAQQMPPGQPPQMSQSQLPAGAPAHSPVALATPEPAILHMRTLQQAKEEHEQIASACWALKAHFDDPSWQPRLLPALQAMASGNLAIARQMVKEFVSPIRADLANDIFVEKVVQTLLRIIQGQAVGPAPAAPSPPAEAEPVPEPVATAPPPPEPPAAATPAQTPEEPEAPPATETGVPAQAQAQVQGKP